MPVSARWMLTGATSVISWATLPRSVTRTLIQVKLTQILSVSIKQSEVDRKRSWKGEIKISSSGLAIEEMSKHKRLKAGLCCYLKVASQLCWV